MNNHSERNRQLSPLKRAFLALEEMQAKLAATEKKYTEPIAIIGMGCRFPGADNLTEFWQLLHNGIDAITEVPTERWRLDDYYNPKPLTPGKIYSRGGGFLSQVDKFDPQFFNISPREASRMDPQQRLLLEVVWETFENAGIVPETLAGSRTGVFVGISNNDYSLLQFGNIDCIDTYTGTGNAFSIAANRISYWLNLQGPSLALDTACSSSLVALHLACQSIHSGESELALAGGVNLILSPEATIIFSQANLMSASSRCHTFDAAADGYIRGEGCGMVLLKRLSQAERAGDNILAVIRGSAVNQDGRSNGITAPNGLAQQVVIREALKNAQIIPEQIGYIEAHGTGTILGDPIEVQSLGAIMKDRPADRPCYLGSVKTNIGHLESAAGIAGLIKVVLSLTHNEIPRNLHFENINPHIPLADFPLKIATEASSWPTYNGRRLAGISSFGFGGTNSHVIVEAAPAKAPIHNKMERPLHLFTLAAQDENALKELAERYRRVLEGENSPAFTDLCFTANTGRTPFHQRFAIAASDSSDLRQKLTQYLAGEFPAGLHLTPPKTENLAGIAFLFTGQGAQYIGMGRELYATQPTFRKALDQCADILKAYLERPLLEIIFSDDENNHLIHTTAYTQPTLFAIEYALAQLWLSWGIRPDYMLGHSVGEYVAACVAGVFDLVDGLKLIAARGRLMQALPQNGAMAVIFADEAQVTRAVESHPGEIAVAGINGPNNVVISGKSDTVALIVKQFEKAGVETRSLKVSHAFHSPLMEPMLDEFTNIAQTINYQAPQIPVISNVNGKMLSGENIPDATYWRTHVREAVRFYQGMQVLAEQNCRTFIEPGPHPVLLGMGRRCLPTTKALWLASLKRQQTDWSVLLASLGELFVHGFDVNWKDFEKDYQRQRVELPTYPFQRERYWVDDFITSQQPRQKTQRTAHEPLIHPLLGQRVLSPLRDIQFETQFQHENLVELLDIQIQGLSCLPMAAYLEMALAAKNQTNLSERFYLKNVNFSLPLIFPNDETIYTVQIVLAAPSNNTNSYQIFSRLASDEWTCLSDGEFEPANPATEAVNMQPGLLTEIQQRCHQGIPTEQFYQLLSDQGLRFGKHFQSLQQLWQNGREALGVLNFVSTTESKYRVDPVLLDACFQLLLGSLTPAELKSMKNTPLFPAHIGTLRIFQPSTARHWGHAIRWAKVKPVQNTVAGDVRLFDENGQIILEMLDLQLKALNQESQDQISKYLNQVAKVPVEVVEETETELTRPALLELAPEARLEMLENYLRSRLARVIGLSANRINVQQPIINLGLDSIMAIEFRNHIEQVLGVEYPIANLLEGPSIRQVAQQLLELLEAQITDEVVKLTPAAEQVLEYPLSYGQRALWFQHQMAPESIFNLRYAVRIQAPLDVVALKQAFHQLVERHPTLRSIFVARKGEPLQQIQENNDLFFQQIDAHGWSDNKLKAEIATAAHRHFDLIQGPLFRVYLFTRSEQDHILLETIHHLVADLWSQAIIAHEIGVLYAQETTLPPLNFQYHDFIRWQTEMLKSAAGEKLWHYWEQKLSGEIPVLNLPTDRPRPAVQSFRGAQKSLSIDVDLARQLKTVSEQHGATLYMTLLAAFQVMLHRYTGQEDVIVGTPTTGRSHNELAPIVGYFVNPLPVRTHLSGELPFTALLEQVRHSVVEAIAHQDYPLALLVEKLGLHRDTSRTPLFQVMFILQRAHLLNEAGLSSFAIGSETNEMTLGKLPLQAFPIEEQYAPFELTLMMAESANGLAAALTYNTDLFNADTIERMLGHYRTLLQNIAANPEQKISRLSMLPAAELKQILIDLNQNQADYPKDKCVHEMFEAIAAQQPDRPALVFEDNVLSYAELNQQANQLAHFLQKQGVGPEVLVGVCVERSFDMIISLLGVLKAGGAYLPMDPDYPTERLTLMVQDAALPILITQQKYVEKFESESLTLVPIDAIRESIATENTENLVSGVLPENLAYVIYTSGSTGRPKGTLLQQRGLINFATAHVKTLGTTNHDRWLQFASFSFDASVSEIFTALFAGATIHLARRETLLSSKDFVQLLKQQAITHAILPPSMLSVLPATDFPDLQTIISAGEACTPEIVSRWAEGRQFYNGYGPTEATVGPTIYQVAMISEEQTSIPIGKPLANIQIYLLDSHLNPVPLGTPGELHIGGICLARGYHNRPEMTAEKFIPHPFSVEPGARLYRTGDLARYLPDGNLEFLGRVDHQVKVRGFRIELQEIEAVLSQHERINEVVVLARKDQTGENRLIAYLVPNHQPLPETTELRNYLKEKLPEYMLPNYFVPLEALPLTPNGKVDRKALPEPTEFQRITVSNYVKPRTEIEQTLARIWQEVLGMEKVGVYDNFFEIGGHSLAMVKVHSQLCETLERDISIVEMFKYPTIHALAKFLNQEQSREPVYIEKQQRATRQRQALNQQRQRMRNRSKK